MNARPHSGKESLQMKEMQIEIIMSKYNQRYKKGFLYKEVMITYRALLLSNKLRNMIKMADAARLTPKYLHFEESYFTLSPLEELQKQEFQLKKGFTSSWNDEEKKALHAFLLAYVQKKIHIKDSDPYRHIS